MDDLKLDKLLNQRVIAPGLIFALFALPLLLGSQPLTAYVDALASLKGVLYTAVVVFFGGAYHALGLRNGAVQPVWDRVNEPIVVTLVDSAMSSSVVESARASLLTRRREVMSMAFYHFIDRDPTLKAKSERVYHNGSFITACVDIYVLGLFFAALYFGRYLLEPSHRDFYALIACALVTLAGFAYYQALPRIETRHRDLGAEQLEIITLQYRSECEQQLVALAKPPS